jgi:hypothetical protein
MPKPIEKSFQRSELRTAESNPVHKKSRCEHMRSMLSAAVHGHELEGLAATRTAHTPVKKKNG